MYGENFGDIFVHWFVFWKIPNQFLRAVPALLSFTANINYYMIIRISLNWAGICSALRPHFLVQSTHSNSFDWFCRGSASSFPCPDGSQCQPEWLWPLAHTDLPLIRCTEDWLQILAREAGLWTVGCSPFIEGSWQKYWRRNV